MRYDIKYIYLNISNNAISMQGESGGWREEKEKWKKGGSRLKGREGREDG